MDFTPPTSPPPPFTAEDEALLAEAEAFYQRIKDEPMVSNEMQQKAIEPDDSVESESDNTPLI